jgi:hypothetical protein
MKLLVLCSLLFTTNLFAQTPPLTQAEANRQQAEAEEARIREVTKKDLERSKNLPKSGLVISVKLPSSLGKRLSINDSDKALIKGDKKLKITKLWNDECENNRVIDLNDTKCFGQAEFAAGSHYSFYHKDYNELLFGNIGLSNGDLSVKSNPERTQIMVDLNDTAIEGVDIKTAGVNILKSFNFLESEKEKIHKQIKNGLTFNGLNLSASTSLTLNHTYLIRAIFSDVIDGRYFKIDAIYAYRVIEFKENVATIIWKEVFLKRRF